MNIYIVKEMRHDRIKVLKVFKDEKKAEAFCNKLQLCRPFHVLNYVVETHILED